MKLTTKFMIILDGCEYLPPLIKELDSYYLGICKLEEENGFLHVHLRRPELLIGQYGETLRLFEEELGTSIYIHEVKLT